MKNVDSIKKNKSVSEKTELLKSSNKKESIWTKEIRFSSKDKTGWSFSKHHENLASELNKKHTSINVKPASRKLIRQAKKIKRAADKKMGAGSGLLRFLALSTRVFFATILLVFVIFASATLAYQNQYKNRAYFGAHVLGENVSGKSYQEISDIIEEKIRAVRFSFEIDGEAIEAEPRDAGIYFDVKETTTNVILNGKSKNWHEAYLWAAGSLFSEVVPQTFSASFWESPNADLAYSVNEEILSSFINNLSLKFNEDSKNAGLVMNGSEVQVIPAVFGRKIVFDSVREQIFKAVKNVRSEKIAIQVEKVNPSILEGDTRITVEEAKALLDIPVVFKYEDKSYSPDRATMGSWIIFETENQNGRDRLVPKFDSKKIYPFVYSLSAKINIPAINKKVTIKNGVETVVEREGKEGLSVDVDRAAFAAAQTLNQKKSVDLLLPTYVVRPKTQVNNIVVADWNKYIVIDLSDQKMCAYLAGGEVVGCWAVTTGATNKGWGTPVGTYLIWSKRYKTDMPNPPYSEPLRNVHYVSYFTYQYHAIHEAWWRSVFGGSDYTWNGSHGCVNAPKNVAQFIYNWAPIGTPVIVQN